MIESKLPQTLARRFGAAGLVSLMLLPAGVSAAEQAQQERRRATLEEVIVTARKIEETSQSVPVAITALSEEMANSNIRDLTDLNGFAPNVFISEDGSRGGGGANINIRGISPTRTDDNSFDSPIGVMIDGIYLGSLAGQVLENFDIERVEILRGPQGTLFGKNTVGGVVHVIRSRPTGEYDARLKFTVGENGQKELRAVANMPVFEDKLAAKFFMTSMEDDGYMKNVTTGNRIPQKDYTNYGVTFLFTPNDRFEALLTMEKFRDESQLGSFQTNYNVAPGVLPVPTDPNDTNYNGGFTNCALFPITCRYSTARPKVSEMDTENNAQLDVDATTLNMSFELTDNLTLVSVTGYRDINEDRIYDFDGSSAPFITIQRWNDYDQFSEELRVDGNWDNLSFTAGVYYWNSEFEQDWVTGGRFWATLFGGVAYNPALWQACLGGAFAPVACDAGLPNGVEAGGDVTQILFETQETESWAGFAQADYTFLEKWTLTLGARWTRETKDFTAGQAYLSNVARQRERNFPEYADLKKTWKDFSPKIGLSYQINDDAMVYASYAEGFHSGGFFGVNQNTRDFIRDQYDPETAESWELGLKSEWLDNRLRVNAALFYNDFTDKQEQSVQLDPDTLTVATTFDNVASAVYKGAELEIQAVLTENLSVFATYGYLDAEYEDFFTDINASDGVTIIEDASFLKPRNAPKNTWGIGGTYTIPLSAGDLELHAKYNWVDEVETNLLNASQARVKSQEELSAYLGFFAERYSVVFFGRNLTDNRVEIFTPIATLFAVGTVNRPRWFGLEATFEF
ncbi:MAG: TonB-dependent receptor [Pseudomonadales bacterium]